MKFEKTITLEISRTETLVACATAALIIRCLAKLLR